MLGVKSYSKRGPNSSLAAFSILDVTPSIPQDWEDFNLAMASDISVNVTCCKSKIGGLAGYGNSFNVAFPVMLDYTRSPTLQTQIIGPVTIEPITT